MIALVLLALGSAIATAQAQTHGEIRVSFNGQEITELTIAVDSDDSDDDGTVDLLQASEVPEDGLAELSVSAAGPFSVHATGGIRLIRHGSPSSSLSVRSGDARTFAVQGTSAAPGQRAALRIERHGRQTEIVVHVVSLAVLNGAHAALDPSTEAVRLSHRITNDSSLPRRASWDERSDDIHNIRLEVRHPNTSELAAQATVEALDERDNVRSRRTLRLTRPSETAPFRSHWLRLVGDRMDESAPGVGDRVLRVALRDRIRFRYVHSHLSHTIRVGRPAAENSEAAARYGQLRIRILRTAGVPAVGSADAGALRLARDQVQIANEIWLQCLVGFGDPARADIAVVDPPVSAMLAVANHDGLPALGGGQVRLMARGRRIGPIQTFPNAAPVDTALDIARALRAQGLAASVTVNAPTEQGAGQSADVLVRNQAGDLVALGPDGSQPLTTDRRQTITIGKVDLSDGIEEFDNMTAAAGTLEERTMIKALRDDDPSTIDIFVVNRFSSGTRQGEAFIEADGGSIINTLILDRNGMRQAREAWTQSHELGHILLDHPLHPDNIGPDRPWLLMDADSSIGLVTGPKRLTPDECRRVRARSGVHASPPLLSRQPGN